MEKRINEGGINGAIDILTVLQIEIILNQMKKSICKIKGQTIGTGFFCKIEIDKEKFPVLITNFHVIDDKFIELNKKVKIQLYNDRIPKIIYLNQNKIFYSSIREEYDIMMIKLDKKDEIDNADYLELDDFLLSEKSERICDEDNSIYILHYYDKEICISYGKGLSKENDFNIIHRCKTQIGSSGSPILDLKTNKVIGIHKAYISKRNQKDSYNIGTFLKYPLMKMKELLQKEKKAISLNNENKENKDLFYRRINPAQHKNYNILFNNKINNIYDNYSHRDFIVKNMNNKRKINKPQNLEINNNTFRNDNTNLNNYANKTKEDYINNIHDRVITDVGNYESNTTDINKNKKYNKLNKNVFIRNFRKNYTLKNIIISDGKEVVIKNNNTALNNNLEENKKNQIYEIKANFSKMPYNNNTNQNKERYSNNINNKYQNYNKINNINFNNKISNKDINNNKIMNENNNNQIKKSYNQLPNEKYEIKNIIKRQNNPANYKIDVSMEKSRELVSEKARFLEHFTPIKRINQNTSTPALKRVIYNFGKNKSFIKYKNEPLKINNIRKNN